MWRIRSWMVIWRLAGTVSAVGSPLSRTATFMLANFGKYFDRGSSIRSLPCSYSNSAPTVGHRLGHGGDVEDGVGGHGDVGRLVAEAIGVELHELAVTGDRDDRAGNPPRIDVRLQHAVDPRQPLAGEPDLLGLGTGQRIFGKGGAGSKQPKCACEQSHRFHECLPFWPLSGPVISSRNVKQRDRRGQRADPSFLAAHPRRSRGPACLTPEARASSLHKKP